jgi:hypothetical protein
MVPSGSSNVRADEAHILRRPAFPRVYGRHYRRTDVFENQERPTIRTIKTEELGDDNAEQVCKVVLVNKASHARASESLGTECLATMGAPYRDPGSAMPVAPLAMYSVKLMVDEDATSAPCSDDVR